MKKGIIIFPSHIEQSSEEVKLTNESKRTLVDGKNVL
jgi:hypothetical protein